MKIQPIYNANLVKEKKMFFFACYANNKHENPHCEFDHKNDNDIDNNNNYKGQKEKNLKFRFYTTGLSSI